MLTARSESDERVVGIGGIFFKARGPPTLSHWYSKHLGIKVKDNVAVFTWLSPKGSKQRGHTVWAIFPPESDYFRSRDQQFMINYRVKDLVKTLQRLRSEGVEVADNIEESKYGKFGWVTDPEGNRVELWEPPKSYEAPEEEVPME